MKPKHHFLVCMNRRPEGHPRGSCQASGATPLFESFREKFEQRNLLEVKVTGTFCLGPCDLGPIVVAYPEGIWYGKVTAADIDELLDSHLEQRGPVKRLEIAV